MKQLDKLREQRGKLGLSQSDVARKVGVSLTAYQLWERQVAKPKPENMEKLKKVLELN